MKSAEVNNIELIKKAIDCNISFAIWSLPDKKEVSHLFCKQDSLIKSQSVVGIDKYSGFVFAPFTVSENKSIYILPFNKNIDNFECEQSVNNELYVTKKSTLNTEISKHKYINHLNKLLTTLNNTDVKKVVLSRNKKMTEYDISYMPKLFDKLKIAYPKAFVYQVFIPNVGYWVGATPEVLLSIKDNIATTVSLAGTKLFNSNVLEWDNKEKNEQELVTKYIHSVLKSFNINDVIESTPQTIKTGQLAHIKTKIEFKSHHIKNRVGEFINKLHPTPAVCGLPVKESKEIIQTTEEYDREYYTGYLGLLDCDKVDLFVNLRCLQAFKDSVVIYAGGGVIQDSDVEKEWEETVLKINSIKEIINKI
jgi:isochorismate synthase